MYFFCINPGRSGSQYLATLFGTDARVAAFHEAPPEMNGDLLRLAERTPYADTYDARRGKADAVRALLARQPDRSVYAETNHMFIKTFFDVAMREFAGARVGVVILRRAIAAVVKSFAELGIFTARNAVWPAWMSDPYALTRAIEPAAPAGTLDALEMTVAYLVDIEARAQRFLRDVSAGRRVRDAHRGVRAGPERNRAALRVGGVDGQRRETRALRDAARERAQGAQGGVRHPRHARRVRGRGGALPATLRRSGHHRAADAGVVAFVLIWSAAA